MHLLLPTFDGALGGVWIWGVFVWSLIHKRKSPTWETGNVVSARWGKIPHGVKCILCRSWKY